MTNTNLNKRLRILSTVAVVLLIAAFAVYAYATLTATTGTINITTRPLASNIQLQGGQLQWLDINGNWQNEGCMTTAPDTLTCTEGPSPGGPVSNPTQTVYVNDTFTLAVSFGNRGTENGTLNSILFQGSSSVSSDGMFSITNFTPCLQTNSGPDCSLTYPITIPMGAGTSPTNQPINLMWTFHVDSVGVGSDSVTLTFNTSG